MITSGTGEKLVVDERLRSYVLAWRSGIGSLRWKAKIAASSKAPDRSVRRRKHFLGEAMGQRRRAWVGCVRGLWRRRRKSRRRSGNFWRGLALRVELRGGRERWCVRH